MISTALITLYALLTPVTSISHSTGNPLPAPSTIASGVYQHYKGNYYLVFFVAQHTETEEEMVTYQALYGDFRVWSRPLAMFVGDVEYNGVVQPRFKRVADSSQAEKFVIVPNTQLRQ